MNKLNKNKTKIIAFSSLFLGKVSGVNAPEKPDTSINQLGLHAFQPSIELSDVKGISSIDNPAKQASILQAEVGFERYRELVDEHKRLPGIRFIPNENRAKAIDRTYKEALALLSILAEAELDQCQQI